MSQARIALGLLALCATLALAPCPARADDGAFDFAAAANNPGQRWTYGWTATRGGAFTLFATHGTASGLSFWNYATNQTRVEHNPGGGVLLGGDTYTPPNGLNLFPGSNGEFAVVRWTAPANGTYTINAHFIPRVFINSSVTSEVAVLHGTALLFDRLVNVSSGLSSASLSATLALSAGETIDFAVGPSDNNSLDTVGLDATVNLEIPNLGNAGPVFSFGGQRYAACRYGTTMFESIAFDAVHHQIASEGSIRDLCGNQISAGPNEAPGLAWDSKTGMYWQVTADRVVRRWSAAGVLVDTAFTLTRTFAVPGSGADTLEDVRGIATDSSFVYLVDAGANPGNPASCEWFKFTRTGTPVKSSKSTNFSATLDLDPDALVDDIVYAPYSSPVYPGKLLVALEHSGIQIIDTNGNFVDKFRWSQQALPNGRPVSAFAGLALDPATGNLYLVNNDNDLALVLVRIVPQGLTSYVVGTEGYAGSIATPTLKMPIPGCDLPLWGGYQSGPFVSGNWFGLAYRPSSNAVYAIDYGNGDLWAFDPRLGGAKRIGPTGVSSAWGLAYDSDRDLIYASTGSPLHIVAINPLSGAAYSLPQPIGYQIGSNSDLAWDSVDKKIYGVDDSANPARLVRIDRDTGIGVVVGNTHSMAGLDYDPATGKLIGHGYGGGHALYSIDPVTAIADSIAPIPAANGFEGLAVIPVPANPLLVGVEPTAAPVTPHAELEASPNPSHAGATIRFTLARSSVVELGVFDVAGRRVRRISSGAMAPGEHQVRWDGHDSQGDALPDGVYFVRLETPERTVVTRLVRVK